MSREEAECSNDIVWALQPPPATTSHQLESDTRPLVYSGLASCTVYSVQYSVQWPRLGGWLLVPHPAIHRELPRPRGHQQQTSASLSLSSAW